MSGPSINAQAYRKPGRTIFKPTRFETMKSVLGTRTTYHTESWSSIPEEISHLTSTDPTGGQSVQANLFHDETRADEKAGEHSQPEANVEVDHSRAVVVRC